MMASGYNPVSPLILLRKRLFHPPETGRVAHLEAVPVVQQVGGLVTGSRRDGQKYCASGATALVGKRSRTSR